MRTRSIACRYRESSPVAAAVLYVATIFSHGGLTRGDYHILPAGRTNTIVGLCSYIHAVIVLPLSGIEPCPCYCTKRRNIIWHGGNPAGLTPFSAAKDAALIRVVCPRNRGCRFSVSYSSTSMGIMLGSSRHPWVGVLISYVRYRYRHIARRYVLLRHVLLFILFYFFLFSARNTRHIIACCICIRATYIH